MGSSVGRGVSDCREARPHPAALDTVDRELRLLLLCSHGFSSSLAAATLVDLGFRRAGDVIRGFEAWSALGLPVAPAPCRRDDVAPGMGGPEP